MCVGEIINELMKKKKDEKEREIRTRGRREEVGDIYMLPDQGVFCTQFVSVAGSMKKIFSSDFETPFFFFAYFGRFIQLVETSFSSTKIFIKVGHDTFVKEVRVSNSFSRSSKTST